MGNALGGSKKTTKIMKVDGKTTNHKTPIQAMDITRDHPGHVLLDSEMVQHYGIRAKPLDPAHFLEPTKVYFLVEPPKFPFDHQREPRRVRSGTIHMGAKEMLEGLMLSRRSISDLSVMKPSGSVVVDDVEEGASGRSTVRVRMRMPKSEVDKVMRESKDKAEAAEKIMDLCVERSGNRGSGLERTRGDSKGKEAAIGLPDIPKQAPPQLRRQACREKSPLGQIRDGCKKRVGFLPLPEGERQVVITS